MISQFTKTHPPALFAVLSGYLLLAVLYSLTTPIFEASDELWHYPMVKYLADNGMQLPPQDPANPGAWRQEGSQPPLYYMLAALLTNWIDTSNMETIRRQNPHADIGIVRPDGNANMIVHRPHAEAFPWTGTVLAVQITRFFSIVLGLGTVYITYLIGREIFPERPIVALTAAAWVAFLPMFLFISGSVNNDNLSNLLGNWLTLQIVRLLKPDVRPTWRSYALLGVVCGAGMLAKLNIGFLIPLVALALLIVSLRQRDWKPLIIGGAISGGLTILIAGWWYLHNYQLYGDPSGINRFLEMVGRRPIIANLAQLWSERESFTRAYWGFFGGVNVPMPDFVYSVFNLIGGIGLMGAGAFILKTIIHREWGWDRWLLTSVTLIWPLVTFISYLRWTAETPASQGRLVFGALSAITLWMIVGLSWWLPKRIARIVVFGSVGWFAAVALLAPFAFIAPAYAAPAQLAAGTSETRFNAPDGGTLGLVNAQVVSAGAQPESYVEIAFDLQIEVPFARDWSLFVHLVTADGVIVGQRDVYPGQGRLATSDLPTGRTWRNHVAVWVPSAAYAPMALDVIIGWYHLPTGDRMTLPDGGETLLIGQVPLRPRASEREFPNPLSINFEGQIELIGYALSDLTPSAGHSVELTLYWRALRQIERDYVVFAQILDPATLTRYAASDAMPVVWTRPTSTWRVGEIIEDIHPLTVDPNTPPGIYELGFGLYLQENDFPRLRILTPDGGMAFDIAYLTRVRVLPATASSESTSEAHD